MWAALQGHIYSSIPQNYSPGSTCDYTEHYARQSNGNTKGKPTETLPFVGDKITYRKLLIIVINLEKFCRETVEHHDQKCRGFYGARKIWISILVLILWLSYLTCQASFFYLEMCLLILSSQLKTSKEVVVGPRPALGREENIRILGSLLSLSSRRKLIISYFVHSTWFNKYLYH